MLAALVAAGAVSAGEAEEAALRSAYDKAVAFLQDAGFYERWAKTTDFGDVERARGLVDQIDAREKRIDEAMKDVRAYCGTRILVNACITKERERSFERKRELSQLRRAASTYLHDEGLKTRTSPIPKRDASEPVEWSPARPKKPSEPVGFKPKTVKPAKEPEGAPASSPRAASAPTSLAPKTVEPVDEAARSAAERANDIVSQQQSMTFRL